VIYAKDTKKYKGCAYPRYFVKYDGSGFKTGDEITSTLAKQGMWQLPCWNHGFYRGRSFVHFRKKTCKRKVVGKDLFNRPVCTDHARMAVLDTVERLRIHQKEIERNTTGISECQKVIERLS
jgi:hypothetical protein